MHRYADRSSRKLSTCALAAAIGFVVLTLLPARATAADDSSAILTVGGFGGYLRTTPVLDDFSTRRGLSYPALDSQRFQMGGLGAFGIDMRVAWSPNRNLYFPVIGGRVAIAVGPRYETTIEANTGEAARVQLRNGVWGEILLPGVGVRAIASGTRVGAAVQLALVGRFVNGAVTFGSTTSEFSAIGASFAVYGDLFACPRVKRVWGCIYLAPMIQTGGLDGPSALFPGGLVGYRIEGP
jgi:hypothetical protein